MVNLNCEHTGQRKQPQQPRTCLQNKRFKKINQGKICCDIKKNLSYRHGIKRVEKKTRERTENRNKNINNYKRIKESTYKIPSEHLPLKRVKFCFHLFACAF